MGARKSYAYQSCSKHNENNEYSYGISCWARKTKIKKEWLITIRRDERRSERGQLRNRQSRFWPREPPDWSSHNPASLPVSRTAVTCVNKTGPVAQSISKEPEGSETRLCVLNGNALRGASPLTDVTLEFWKTQLAVSAGDFSGW